MPSLNGHRFDSLIYSLTVSLTVCQVQIAKGLKISIDLMWSHKSLFTYSYDINIKY